MRRRLAALLAGLLALPVSAQEGAVVGSSAPEAVSVTVYRDPNRGSFGDGTLKLDWLGGFALVTDTRTLRLPAGRATIRFEGVAGGIVPASAIVTGLPGGTIEKNRDARLLSAASLVNGYLGRRVTLTRTDRATGRVRVQDATVVAGPAGGVVVRTPDGVEALGCSGLAEATRYPAVPADLSARPVLSIETVSPQAATATVTLSYLTSEFDWSASYVATVAPDGRHLDLFAWLTLANGNGEGFQTAQVQAVAGRLNHAVEHYRQVAERLRLDCYPLGTTTSDLSTIVAQDVGRFVSEDIVVTGARMMAQAVPAPPPPPAPLAPPEDLGDLKLYRVPERVSVAAHGQKQVALLARSGVPFERVYRRQLWSGGTFTAQPTQVSLRLRNVTAAGLGLPLPAGSTSLYARHGGERVLVGTGALADKAVGEALRLDAGWSRQVLVSQTHTAKDTGRLELTNANPFPVTAEIALSAGTRPAAGGTLPFVEGQPTWTARVPANGRAVLDYRVKR